MILLDTNVLIYAADRSSPLHGWARETIAAAVAGVGCCINAVSLAEVCVGDVEPDTVADRLRSWGVVIVDVPAAAAVECSRAYTAYRERRHAECGKDSPRMPLPDFFIGAHALIMGWTLATADARRIAACFPDLVLTTP